MGIPIHQNYHYSASSSLSSNDSHHQTTLSLFGGGGGSTLESRRLMEPPPTFSSLNRLLELASGGTGGSRQTIRNRHNYVSSSLDIQPTFATADPPLRSASPLIVIDHGRNSQRPSISHITLPRSGTTPTTGEILRSAIVNELIGTPQESSTPAPTSDQFHNAIMSGVGPSASSSNLPRLLFPPTNSTNNNRPQSARNPRLQLVSQQIEDILSTIITNARRIGSSDAGNDHIIESPTTTTTSSTDSFDDYFRQDRRDGRGEDIGIPTPARLIAIDRSVQRYRDFHRGGGGGGGGGEISSLIQEVNENPIPTTVIESSPIVEHDPEEEDFKFPVDEHPLRRLVQIYSSGNREAARAGQRRSRSSMMQQSIQRGLDQLPGQPHHHPLLSSTENAAEDREERYRRVRRRGEVSDPWLFANSGRLSSSSARGRHQTRADNLIQDEYEEQLTAMNADDSDDDSDSDFIVSSRLFASGSGVGSYYNNNATTNLLRRRATIRRSGLQQRRATTLSSSSSSPLNIAFTVNPEPFQPGDFGSSSDDNTSGESSNGIFGSGSNIGSNDRLASRRDSLNSIGTSSSSSSSRSRGRLETRDMERDISVYNNNNDNTTQLLAPQNTRFPSQSTSRGELNIDSPTPASQTSTFMTASQLRAQQLVRILRRRQSGLAPTVSSSTNPLSSSPVNPDFTVSNSNSNDSNGGEDVVQRTINQRVSSLSFQDLSTSPAPSSPAYTLLPSHESSSQATVVSSPNTTLGEPNNLQQEQQVHQQQQQQQSQPSALNYSLRTTARSRDERMAYILRSASTTISELSSNINERFSRISSSEITGNVNPQQRQNEGLSSVDEANNLGDRLLTFNQRRNRLLASAAVDDPIAFRLVPSQPPNIEDVPSSRNSSETNYINNNNNRNNNTSSNSTNSSSSMIPRSVNNPSVSVALNSLMASTFQRWQSLRQDLATAAGLSLQTARLFQQSSALLNSGGRLNQDGESGGTSFADHSPPGQLPPENPDGDDLMPTLDLSVNGGSLTRPTSMPSVTSLLSTLHRNATASIGADRGEASTTITTTTTGTTNSAFDQPGM